MQLKLNALAILILTSATAAYAFEDTKVLPKGVRNVNIRTVNTDFDETTDNGGAKHPLAEPLAQQLTFGKIAKGQDAAKATQLRAFLLQNNFNESDSVGEFTADMKGHLSVFAPIASYGVTEKLTLAIAAPIYSAQTSVSVGFQPNARAQAFIAALNDPKNNQTAAARDAAAQLNGAVASMNRTLASNGYREMKDWQGQGMGDMTLAGKYQHLNNDYIGLASTSGLIAPTGRTHDPDILNDVPFGYGVWAAFAQGAIDEKLPAALTLNQYTKYTVRAPGQKKVRAVTDQESVAVGYAEPRYKIGDQVDAGTSLRWEPRFGLVTGVGYNYYHKYGDIYRGDLDPSTKGLLQRNSEQKANNAELMLGYSTVPLYLAGSFAVPFDVKLTYDKQLASRNMPITDLAQFDLNLYF